MDNEEQAAPPGKKYPLATARKIAEKIVAEISPYCERCHIAGSVRREKAEVKDIEIVALPKWSETDGAADLFGAEKVRVNLLRENLAARETVRWIKPGTSVIEDWPLKPDAKYWRGLMPNGIKLDVFLATEQNYGMIYLMRTGSWEFNVALFTHAKRVGTPARGGYLWHDGKPLSTPEEVDVFTWTGICWVDPRDRIDGSAVRPSESFLDSRPDGDRMKKAMTPIEAARDYADHGQGEVFAIEILEEAGTQVKLRFTEGRPAGWAEVGWFPKAFLC